VIGPSVRVVIGLGETGKCAVLGANDKPTFICHTHATLLLVI
jgi:hypothetical protein